MNDTHQPHCPSCTIIESNRIDSVLEHAQNNNTLVVLDIDNTLVHTNQELGSDAWAYWFVKKKIMEGLPLNQALDYMFDLFKHVHAHIDVYPVEEQSVDVVHKLKELEVPTICLTGRPGRMIDITQEQLKNAGFVINSPDDFNKTMTLNMGHRVEMANGIICGGLNDKGDVIAHLFKTLTCTVPDAVVLVDDKKSCIESMSKRCAESGVDYTGLRYGYMDPIVAKFDAKKAEEQLEQLLKSHAFSR